MVLHVNHKLMTMSQTWSYMKNTYRILCHDIYILTIPKVRMGLFGRRNTVDAFTISHIHLPRHSFHFNSI
ncbi:hypothetical protein F383_11618 [Gossypium arboreum]|uniref:Uncharacterized protein n=1 Tax=Gossypium arboreum TaxID=29729 RepID=A0A0B0N637_GOSAR|nr:hypothetical protein F383_11618 [Gossypium arboreum]